METMRKVYRYEDSSGCGPYRATWPTDQWQEDLFSAHNGSATHPTWCGWVDGDVEIPYSVQWDGAKAGCATREALAEWFEGFTDVLEENGFTVQEYEVPASHVCDGRSGRQLVFYVDED